MPLVTSRTVIHDKATYKVVYVDTTPVAVAKYVLYSYNSERRMQKFRWHPIWKAKSRQPIAKRAQTIITLANAKATSSASAPTSPAAFQPAVCLLL